MSHQFLLPSQKIADGIQDKPDRDENENTVAIVSGHPCNTSLLLSLWCSLFKVATLRLRAVVTGRSVAPCAAGASYARHGGFRHSPEPSRTGACRFPCLDLAFAAL